MKTDLSALEEMVYSGRGITLGMTPEGNPFVAYTLTGRSPPSQARRLVQENSGIVRTDVTDKEQLEKGSPALLLYPAIVPVPESELSVGANIFPVAIASNGAQTAQIMSDIRAYKVSDDDEAIASLNEAMDCGPQLMYDHHEDRWIDVTSYEPDSPNNTPRITGAIFGNTAAFHMVSADGEGDLVVPERKNWELELKPGVGHLLTTYNGGNESPLKSFEGDPRPVEIGTNSHVDLASEFYKAIQGGQEPGDNYAVAAAVMLFTEPDKRVMTAIENRHGGE